MFPPIFWTLTLIVRGAHSSADVVAVKVLVADVTPNVVSVVMVVVVVGVEVVVPVVVGLEVVVPVVVANVVVVPAVEVADVVGVAVVVPVVVGAEVATSQVLGKHVAPLASRHWALIMSAGMKVDSHTLRSVYMHVPLVPAHDAGSAPPIPDTASQLHAPTTQRSMLATTTMPSWCFSESERSVRPICIVSGVSGASLQLASS